MVLQIHLHMHKLLPGKLALPGQASGILQPVHVQLMSNFAGKQGAYTNRNEVAL